MNREHSQKCRPATPNFFITLAKNNSCLCKNVCTRGKQLPLQNWIKYMWMLTKSHNRGSHSSRVNPCPHIKRFKITIRKPLKTERIEWRGASTLLKKGNYRSLPHSKPEIASPRRASSWLNKPFHSRCRSPHFIFACIRQKLNAKNSRAEKLLNENNRTKYFRLL